MKYQESYIMIYAKGILQKNCQTVTQKDNEDKMTQFEYSSPRKTPSWPFTNSKQTVCSSSLTLNIPKTREITQLKKNLFLNIKLGIILKIELN